MDIKFQFSDLVRRLEEKGLVERMEIGEDFKITGFSAIHDTRPNTITWSLTGDADWQNIQAAAVVVPSSCDPPEAPGLRFIRTPDPRKAFIIAMHEFLPKVKLSGISKRAVIGENSTIGNDVYIGDYVVISHDVNVGDNTQIYPNVVIYDNVNIGNNCVIHSGTVIGSVGFQYIKSEEGLLGFPHIGGITIENNVEIGSNNNIERGTLSDTIIRKGAKIDDLCSIGHNVLIEEDCIVTGGSLIFGSATLRRGCYVAPGAMVREHLVVGENATVGMGAVVTKDVGEGETVIGIPARPMKKD